ncbi:MAG: hypothetical protein NT172_07785 [Planctomycetota bacterium]|nr:hypothetical protein [Planctomycetota bacterium]RLS24696.1 MAG: hypothetical protein DWH73_03040 [Planctomycetota bacterium]
MSTGGKVLVVLVTLLTIVWFGLMSMLARLNTNYGNAVIQGETALTALEQQVKESFEKLRDMENEVENSHFAIDDDRTLLRLEYNDQVKAVAETQESLLRLEGLFNTLSAARTETETNIAKRKKEVADDQVKLAKTSDEVDAAKQLNSDLLVQLSSLRKSFQQLSEANRSVAAQLAKSEKLRDVSQGSPLVTGR